MRFIDPNIVRQNIPEGWEARAKTALTTVALADQSKRSKVIDKNARIWGELKSILASISCGKCWYCESAEGRSDNAVDHFRPKNRVVECEEHPGYWWQAFAWENYRFTCTFCNSKRIDREHSTEGGKHDHFPLWDESRRCHCEDDDHDAEQPLLLDPCQRLEPAFLWFDENGRAVTNPEQCGAADSFPSRSVSESIRLFHLDQVDLVERRSQLCREIRDRVEEADRMLQKFHQGDTTAKDALNSALKWIRSKLENGEEYSACAEAFLMGLRGSSPSVDIILRR